MGCSSSSEESVAPTTDRQQAVAERGSEVMPFDLDATMHVFTPTDDGGVQDVVAEDSTATEQVRLIREHLAEETERFARGDFGDPASIHGDDMPGLTVLADAHDRLEVTYSDIADGGRITYVGTSPEVVAAVHDWFAAQVADHGDHAMTGDHADMHREMHGEAP
ncbi:MAG: aspartate carbamoyltransferase [Acidimicrobiia bacterium]|nr:aspartate carbamoyltransferase [Acidimicrobiia bacterium]